MSMAYQYLYCLENLLRLYIEEHPSRENIRIPASCQKNADIRKEDEMKHKWASLRGNSILYYLDFKDLCGILTHNWDFFASEFPSQTRILGKMDDMSRCRNLIAHNSYLQNEEQALISATFNLITRQLGLNKSRSAYIKRASVPTQDGFVLGLSYSAVWTYQETSDGAELPLIYPASLDVAPILLRTFFEQIGIAFYIHFENARVRIFPNFKTGRRHDVKEEFRFKENVLFQVGQYDIDGDGIGELFICIQDYKGTGLGDGLEIKVFKYYPPVYRQHSNRANNWELIGDFQFDSINIQQN